MGATVMNLHTLEHYMRLYHNPRCSKSRTALALLEMRGIDFEEYRYLDVGISLEDIDLLLTLDGIVRTTEDDFKKSTIDLDNLKEVKALLLTTPSLLQRPILVINGEAKIGRPPENILTLLPDA